MKSLFVLAVVFTVGSLLAAIVMAQNGVPASVRFVGHDTVAAVVAKGGPLIEDPGLRILAQHRGAGAVEYHEKTHHIFLVLKGEATLITGGTLIDPKPGGPGQMRASGIEGGQVHQVTKGDVITIPAKTPHWWKVVPTETIDLYSVNIEP